MNAFGSHSNVLKNLMFGTKAKKGSSEGNKILGSKVTDTPAANAKIGKPMVEQPKTSNGAPIALKTDSKQAESASTKAKNKKRKKNKAKNNAKEVRCPADTIQKQSVQVSHEDRIKQLRRERHIHVYGTDLLDPVANFETMFESYHMDKAMLTTISEVFRYEAPTAIQMQVIPFLCERRQVLACAPTGSGKTAAFLVPIIHHCATISRNIQQAETKPEPIVEVPVVRTLDNSGSVILKPRALVLAPTAELAGQIFRVALLLTEKIPSVKCLLLDPSTNSTCESRCDILISTPNRLVYSLIDKGKTPKEAKQATKKNGLSGVDLSTVEWLVVDECDKLFEDGVRGFRDQLASLFQACNSPNVRYALFSATYAHELETWCKSQLDNLVCVYVGLINAAVSNVKQELKFVGDEYGKLLALRELLSRHFEPPALMFVQSRQRAIELLRALLSSGVQEAALRGHVDVLHASMTNQQRTTALQRLRTGVTWLLVCTDIAARGLDIRNVRLVVNYDMPTSEIVYIHRIGRTGRAGQPGHAVTLFTEDDRVMLNHVARVMKRAGFEVPAFALELSKLRGKQKKQVSRRPPSRDAVGQPRDERAVRAKQRRDKLTQRAARSAKQAEDEEKSQLKRKRVKPQLSPA